MKPTTTKPRSEMNSYDAIAHDFESLLDFVVRVAARLALGACLLALLAYFAKPVAFGLALIAGATLTGYLLRIITAPRVSSVSSVSSAEPRVSANWLPSIERNPKP